MRKGYISFVNIGLTTTKLRFDGTPTVMKKKDPDWQEEISYLKITELDYT